MNAPRASTKRSGWLRCRKWPAPSTSSSRPPGRASRSRWTRPTTAAARRRPHCSHPGSMDGAPRRRRDPPHHDGRPGRREGRVPARPDAAQLPALPVTRERGSREAAERVQPPPALPHAVQPGKGQPLPWRPGRQPDDSRRYRTAINPTMHSSLEPALPPRRQFRGTSRRTTICPGLVPGNDHHRCMHSGSVFCMQSTSVRIDVATHEEIKRLANDLGTTVGETVALAVRRLRQERMGQELRAPLRNDESAWLDAELG